MVYRHAEEGRLTEGERGWPKMALGDRWKRGEKGSDVHYSYILQNEQLLVPCLRTQREWLVYLLTSIVLLVVIGLRE